MAKWYTQRIQNPPIYKNLKGSSPFFPIKSMWFFSKKKIIMQLIIIKLKQ